MEGRPPPDLEQQNQQDEEEVPNKQTIKTNKIWWACNLRIGIYDLHD